MIVYRCDECDREMTQADAFNEVVRYRRIGVFKPGSKEITRSTQRHLCEPCIERIHPPVRGVRT